MRSLVIILTPLILVQGVTGYVFIDRHWSWVTQYLGRTLSVQILTILEMKKQNDPLIEITKDRFSFKVRTSGASPFLRDQWERKKQTYHWDERYLENILKSDLAIPFSVHMDDESIHVDVLQSPRVVHFRFPRKHLFPKTTPIFLLWSLGTPFVFFVIAALFMRNQVRPIRRLAEAATRFGRTQEIRFFKPEGSYEVRKAGAAFNQMQERLVRQITQRTRMLAGVSHDLRTPLTRMELQLALMSPQKGIKGLKSDLREMNKIIDTYIDFARDDRKEPSHWVDLSPLIKALLKKLNLSKNVVYCDLSRELKILGRKNMLERCFINLLNNAKKYAKTIWIQGYREGDVLHLIIEDDGPGIPIDQREHVLRAFYRLESSRNRKTGGSGLGLSIVHDTVLSHGGTLSLNSSPHGGLKVDIIFPV